MSAGRTLSQSCDPLERLVSPDAVCRLLMDEDEAAERLNQTAPDALEHGHSFSHDAGQEVVRTSVEAIFSPRGRSRPHSLNFTLMKADFDAELQSSSKLSVMRGSLTARRAKMRAHEDRDPRAALRPFRKAADEIPRRRTKLDPTGEGFQEFRADTPLSQETLLRVGLTIADLKPTSWEQCLVDCQENEKVAAVKFEMLEDNRRSLIRRCLDTRQYVARLAAQQSGVCDRDIRWVFQRVARDVDAPTAEMHQGVQDIDRGVLDMPAWILCLEHLGHLDNRGSAAALAADGGDLRDGRHRGARGLYTLQEAQDAFKDTGCELLNFGTFRCLLMRVVKTTRQRAEEQRRTTDDRKRFGKQLADRSLERKERLRHFEGIQRKQLSLVLANEVTARDRLVKIRGRLEEASSRVAHFRSQRQEKISQRMTKVEETYREHMRQVERQVARLEQDKKDKVARKALAQKEWMERLAAEKAVDAAIKHSRRLVRAELETNRQMQMQRAAAYRHAALERHLSQKALVPLVKRAQEDHLTREHKADMHAWHMQRECLSNVKETLAANGCVRAVPDMLRDNHDFAALKRFTKEAVAGEASSQFETCLQDMDPASAPLDLNSWASGEVCACACACDVSSPQTPCPAPLPCLAPLTSLDSLSLLVVTRVKQPPASARRSALIVMMLYGRLIAGGRRGDGRFQTVFACGCGTRVSNR